MARKRTRLGLIFLTAAVVACGQIAGLEDPVPDDTSPISRREDGGTTTTAEGLSVSPTMLSLGDVACGEPATKGSLSLSNVNETPLDFEVRLPESSVFSLESDVGTVTASGTTLKGTLGPHDQAFVYVNATSSAPQAYKADLVVRAGTSLVTVPVDVAVKGGVLDVSPTVLDFGEVRKLTASSPLKVKLANGGNERLTVTGFAGVGTEFTVGGAPLALEPGAEQEVDATLKSGPASDTPVEATITPTTDKKTCTAIPTFALKGKRVDQDVLVGPATVDFGTFDCGATPSTTKKISVTNYNTTDAAAFTVTLKAGTHFSLQTPGTDSVAKASSVSAPTVKDIVLGSLPLDNSLGTYSETVDVDITAPPASVGKKTVTLRIDVVGAILQITPASQSGFAPDQEKSFTIKNAGNYPVNVGYSLQGAGFTLTDSDDYLNNGFATTDTFGVKFTAPDPGTYNATVVFTRLPPPFLLASGKICTATVVTVSATR